MADPVCECGHELHRGRCGYWECKPKHEDCYNCPCEEFTDARIAGLLAEVARLTPQATRSVPTTPGYYHWRPDNPRLQHAVVQVAGTSRLCWGWFAGSDIEQDLRKLPPGWWSREPIAPMTTPEGGEG